MVAKAFFYAIHDDEDGTVVSIDGPFKTTNEALENAFLNCCSGEPGDPVFRWKKAKKDKDGRFVAKSKGDTATVSIR